MKQFSNELSYEVFEDGYEIFLHGDRWMVQHEPNIPNHEMTYEEMRSGTVDSWMIW